MSLDVYLLEIKETEIFSSNITHNLNEMARKAGIYEALWRPEEINAKKARHIIKPLSEGLKKLRKNPENFKPLNPSNGWGSYEGLVKFVDEYLTECMKNPNAKIEVSR